VWINTFIPHLLVITKGGLGESKAESTREGESCAQGTELSMTLGRKKIWI
jgi:hypothetical protein